MALNIAYSEAEEYARSILFPDEENETDSTEPDPKPAIASGEESAEEADSCQPEDEHASYEDPTREPLPTEAEANAQLEKAKQSKPSDPTDGSNDTKPSFDLERMARQRGDHRINWGPDGETTPSSAPEETTPSFGPCGPSEPTPDRPE
jgi:hypothetical protein